MKRIVIGALIIAIQGCATPPKMTQTASTPNTSATTDLNEACVGSTALSAELIDKFKLIDDPDLLAQSMGEPLKGKLCQGAVYQSTQEVTIYRAWNSTNPNSQFGQWWAFNKPAGYTADYRKDYEICYQWSPLDKLVKCTLKEGVKVVVGNGQSAQCSEYLRYPVSEKQQVFITNASDVVLDCQNFNSVMRWE